MSSRTPNTTASPGTSSPVASKTKRPREIDGNNDDVNERVSPGHAMDCDEIRQRIMAFLDTGEMNVGQFVATLGVSNPSYYRFMRLAGADQGAGSIVHTKATRFFQRRDSGDTTMDAEQETDPKPDLPKVKRVKKETATKPDKVPEATVAPPSPAASPSPEPEEATLNIGSSFTAVNGSRKTSESVKSSVPKAKLAKPAATKAVAVAAKSASPSASTAEPAATKPSSESPTEPTPTVTLPGEESDSVPVYDTCDEIRRKVGLHFTSTGISQAAFLRQLEGQYHAAPRKIQSVQLQRFRGLQGPDAGNSSPLYYAAYVFFEKLRVAQNKPKTKMREKMEHIYPNGVDTNVPPARKK